MDFQKLLGPPQTQPYRVGLAGFGEFGRSLAVQVKAHPCLELAGVCDLDRAATSSALAGLGLEDCFLTKRSNDLISRPLDMLVEATGDTKAAAANALAAFAAGIHVAMASKEADSMVGPALHEEARKRGLVHTPIYGDQPALLIALLGYARIQGFEVVAAGKASEYDLVFDPASQELTWKGETRASPDFAGLWTGGPLVERCARRAAAAPWVERINASDICEMTIVLNHTDLMPDRPMLHGPIARPGEVPDLFKPECDGGLFTGEGRIDVFTCLRRPDEASFAGGVFVIVRCTDDTVWKMLAGKGHPVSADGKYAMIYNPQHLLGLEVPLTLLLACQKGLSSGAAQPRQRFDMVARVMQPFPKGAAAAMDHRHVLAGIQAEITAARPYRDSEPAPYYLAAHAPMRQDVASGGLLRHGDIVLDRESELYGLFRQRKI